MFYTTIISTSSLWRAFLFLVMLSLLLYVFILLIKLYNFIHVERVLHCERFSSNVFITNCVLILSHIFKRRQANNRNDAGGYHKTAGVRTRAPRLVGWLVPWGNSPTHYGGSATTIDSPVSLSSLFQISKSMLLRTASAGRDFGGNTSWPPYSNHIYNKA